MIIIISQEGSGEAPAVEVNMVDLKRRNSRKLLTTLVDEGDYFACEEFIASGQDVNAPNSRGDTGLDVAIIKKNFKLIDLILESGGDFSKTNPKFNALDNAACSNDAELIEFLCSRGADPNGEEEKAGARPPIFWAVQEDHLEALDVLLKRGANPNVIDSDGCIPLVQAAAFGNIEIVKCLLENGADLRALENGTSALEMALAYENEEVAELLRNAEKAESK